MMSPAKRKILMQEATDFVNFYKQDIIDEIKKGVYFESKEATDTEY